MTKFENRRFGGGFYDWFDDGFDDGSGGGYDGGYDGGFYDGFGGEFDGGFDGGFGWPTTKRTTTTTRRTKTTKRTTTTTKFINACLGQTDCDINADCQPIGFGEYECTCKFGYAGDGKNCHDINECIMGIHDCHPFQRQGSTDH